MHDDEQVHGDQPKKRERTDESIAERFPDRGEFPGNDVVEDPDAEPAPNTAHPE